MSTRSLRFIDVVVCLLLLPLIGGFVLATASALQEEDLTKRCAANLRQIGQAILLYSNDNKGPYPRTMFALADQVKPVWGTGATGKDPFMAGGPEPNDVTAALYLLMRTQHITSGVFVCPATLREGWDFGGKGKTAIDWSNWRGAEGIREHLGYSYSNPYPDVKGISAGYKLNNSLGAEFAVAADMNPGTDALLKLTLDSPPMDMRAGNSLNHGRDGQNVLYGDGAVRFADNPFAGSQRDNIYTYGPSGVRHRDKGGEGIVGSPVDANDSVLLPTAKDVGLVDAAGNIKEGAVAKPLTPAELDALRQKLVGQYIRDAAGPKVRLEITADRLIASGGPITATYGYQVNEQRGERISLTLSAPDTKPEKIDLVIERDGGVLISGNAMLQGRWKRQP